MSSVQVVRWYLFAGAISLFCSWIFQGTPEVPQAPGVDAAWSIPTTSSSPVDKGAADRLIALKWWGPDAAVPAGHVAQEKDSARAVENKVDWRFMGVVEGAGKRLALIVPTAGQPPKLFAVGEVLPGGEHLESVSLQGIRYSLPSANDGKHHERKLYAPHP